MTSLLNHSSIQGNSSHNQLYLMKYKWGRRWDRSSDAGSNTANFGNKQLIALSRLQKKKVQHIHGLTCSSIKSSSNTRPAVSTGSNTLPSALRVFKIASDIETKRLNWAKYDWDLLTRNTRKFAGYHKHIVHSNERRNGNYLGILGPFDA